MGINRCGKVSIRIGDFRKIGQGQGVQIFAMTLFDGKINVKNQQTYFCYIFIFAKVRSKVTDRRIDGYTHKAHRNRQGHDYKRNRRFAKTELKEVINICILTAADLIDSWKYL